MAVIPMLSTGRLGAWRGVWTSTTTTPPPAASGPFLPMSLDDAGAWRQRVSKAQRLRKPPKMSTHGNTTLRVPRKPLTPRRRGLGERQQRLRRGPAEGGTIFLPDPEFN